MTDAKKISFHYIKSNLFRVVHADGAVGNITPSGDIFFGIYSQRGPIPQIAKVEVLDDGELGEEIPSERVTKEGVIREVEVGVTMSTTAAQSLIDWLKMKIELVETMRKSGDA